MIRQRHQPRHALSSFYDYNMVLFMTRASTQPGTLSEAGYGQGQRSTKGQGHPSVRDDSRSQVEVRVSGTSETEAGISLYTVSHRKERLRSQTLGLDQRAQ